MLPKILKTHHLLLRNVGSTGHAAQVQQVGIALSRGAIEGECDEPVEQLRVGYSA